MHLPNLNGRVALVTGASRGIGSAIAAGLAAAGASVAVNYRQRQEEALGVVARLHALGTPAIAVRADVSVSAEVAVMHREVRDTLGMIDILVNNAGRGTVRGIDELDESEFDLTIAVNLKSAFLCTQAVIPDMRARQSGRIINISSVAARIGGVVGVHYNASKAGLEGLTRSYAAQLARDGITVNAIAPGVTDTELAGPLKQAALSASRSADLAHRKRWLKAYCCSSRIVSSRAIACRSTGALISHEWTTRPLQQQPNSFTYPGMAFKNNCAKLTMRSNFH